MTTVLLALGAALAYGLSDFLGGVVSRRTSVWPVAFTACLGAALGTLVLALVVPGDPSRADLLWGLLAGVGSGSGTAFLYRGFASGRMGVVAPVSAVGAAVLPVAIGVVVGERPSALVWLGILVALPGIWLVSREPAADDAARRGGGRRGRRRAGRRGVRPPLRRPRPGARRRGVPAGAGHAGGLVPLRRRRRRPARGRPRAPPAAGVGRAWEPECSPPWPWSPSCWPGSRAC